MVAVVIIGTLSTIAVFSLYLGLKTNDSITYIINVSGQQRMLSQRIASMSQQYYLATYSLDKATVLSADELVSNLQVSIRQMRTNNDALSSGNLKKRIDDYLQLTESILQSKSKSEALGILTKIVSLSNTLLPDLMETVLQYQKEGEANIAVLRNIALASWILILLALFLEIIFIFNPMSKKMGELFQKITFDQENLQQLIELRTLSLEQANLKLLHIASHDPLTGLKNRLNLEKDLEMLIVHHHEHHSPFAVAMLDIDFFKKINDTYGHDAGDFILCEIAKIFKENVREQDNVYRSGGEEFVILFNRITKEQALKKMNKIRLTIQESPFTFNQSTIHCTISGGLYHPESVEIQTVQKILKESDVALYHAKNAGRNQIVEVEKTKL